MEFRSLLKRKGILPFVTMWMGLEDIMPSDITHSSYMEHLNGQLYRLREQNGGCQGLKKGWRNEELVFNGYNRLGKQDEQVLETCLQPFAYR